MRRGVVFHLRGQSGGRQGSFFDRQQSFRCLFSFPTLSFAARRSVATPAIANFRGPLPLKIHGCYFDRGKVEKRKMILTFLPECL